MGRETKIFSANESPEDLEKQMNEKIRKVHYWKPFTVDPGAAKS